MGWIFPETFRKDPALSFAPAADGFFLAAEAAPVAPTAFPGFRMRLGENLVELDRHSVAAKGVRHPAERLR